LDELRATFILAGAFTLGAVIGSFLNVVIFRLPREDEGLTVTWPRLSICPECRTTIPWYDNIPLVSYFVLLGRCRACRKQIPLRYFGVELLTASLFCFLAWRLLLPDPALDRAALFAVQALLVAALVAVTFIDIDFRIIPDKIDIPGMLLAPVASALVPALHLGRGDLETLGIAAVDPAASPRLYAALASVLGIAVGGGIIWLIGILGTIAFKKDAMGFGDVKLLAMIGGYVGWKGVLLALFVGCLAGSVIGIVVRLATKDPYIPFGPFLSLGALVVILWYSEVVALVFEGIPRFG
jgi:leader peptidase (prepilin peptidase)/N-methyltransferase